MNDYILSIDAPGIGSIKIIDENSFDLAELLFEKVKKKFNGKINHDPKDQHRLTNEKQGDETKELTTTIPIKIKKQKKVKVKVCQEEPKTDPQRISTVSYKIMSHLWDFPDSTTDQIFEGMDKRGIRPGLTKEKLLNEINFLNKKGWITWDDLEGEKIYSITEDGRIVFELKNEI